MLAFLGLGFVLGMQHALEADHIAAVSSIAARRTHVGDIVKHGLTWGLGHTVTLFVFAGAALMLGQSIPEHIERPLETAVGVMLVGLGAHLLWRLWRERVPFHPHIHGDGAERAHVHHHATDMVHSHGLHAQGTQFRWRSLLVGLMHGMAGSAALLVLTVSQAKDPVQGLLYVLLFGIGSMIGMGLLSSAIALPIAASAKFLTWANRGLQIVVGVATVSIGLSTILHTTLAQG